MAGSGYWRNRWRYQAPISSKDAVGQASVAWVDVCVVAGVATPQQREVLDDLGVAVRTDITVEAAWHPAIRAEGRIVDMTDGTAYDITGVVDPDGGKRRRLRITAASIGGGR